MPLPTLLHDVLPLQDREVREAFQELVSYLVKFDEFPDAVQTHEYLQWLLRQPEAAPRDLEVIAFYTKLLHQLQFIALPSSPDGEVEEFFKTCVTVGLLNPEIDLWHKVVGKLLRIPVFEQRDPLRARLRAALESNEEVLTEAAIKAADKTLPGTAGNWLADYRKAVGVPSVSTLVRTAYLTNSTNTKNLSAKDQDKLKRLIALYEKLKLSSMEDEGMEEQYVFERDGKFFVLREGRLEEARDENAEALMQRLREKGFFTYPDLPITERWARFREEQKQGLVSAKRIYESVWSEVKDEYERVKQSRPSRSQLLTSLYNAVAPGPGARVSRTTALAVLFVLAERGELDALLASESKMKVLYEELLCSAGKTALLEGLRVAPQTPVTIRGVLRMILEEKLKISIATAASIGARLGAFMKEAGKPQYFDLAYFDAEQAIFIWKT